MQLLQTVVICMVLGAFAVAAQRSPYRYRYQDPYPSRNQRDYQLYLQHRHCLRRCDAYDHCDGNCICISRGDFPHIEEGLCFDPSIPIPEHFRGLGYRHGYGK
uniref:Putative secreted protein n=1 Tax=Amblyomma triste TaxID=251400 RepID=A0A023G3V3_AMBTT